jgi:tetratricopeptide (TPR) repeat protein
VLLLLGAFLLPNLGALACGFVLDDLPLIVENSRLHSWGRIAEVWTGGYWPDRLGLTLYRPLTQTVWMALWSLGGGRPALFHVFSIVLGAVVVVLVHRLLRDCGVRPRPALLAAFLFALLPIHTEATTSVVGSAELLAAVLGLGSVLAYRRGRWPLALGLFAAAVLSKESAATLAGLAVLLEWIAPPRVVLRARERGIAAVSAALIVGASLVARAAVSLGPSFVPAVDNPMSLVDTPRRVLTALWIQVLYLQKSLLPLTLSADYSYREIRLVMGLDDPRAWSGILLAIAALVAFVRVRAARLPIALWVVPFAATANVLFPIGTTLAERLAYLPSLGLALGVALAVSRLPDRSALVVLSAVCVLYGGRTAARNLDWRDASTFYRRLAETSPSSAKSHYFLGALLASEGEDRNAVAAYDRAIAIFPAYSEAYHNRGNALARLGERSEAMESYRQCLRFDPGHQGAARNLAALEAGERVMPERRKL